MSMFLHQKLVDADNLKAKCLLEYHKNVAYRIQEIDSIYTTRVLATQDTKDAITASLINKINGNLYG